MAESKITPDCVPPEGTEELKQKITALEKCLITAWTTRDFMSGFLAYDCMFEIKMSRAPTAKEIGRLIEKLKLDVEILSELEYAP